MKQFKVPVVYSMTGTVVVEAESREQLMQQLQSGTLDTSDLPLPTDASYLEDSFEIDTDGDVYEM